MSKFDARPDVSADEPPPRIAVGADLQPDPSGQGLPPGKPRAAEADEVAGEPQFAAKTVTVEVSIDHCSGGYLSRHFEDARIQATRLTVREALALKALYESLHAQHEKLPNGRHVDRQPDALRWILNKIADQLPPELVESARAAA